MKAFIFLAIATKLVAATYSSSTRNVDVLIVGGGPSGTYAAVSLRDQGKSVIAIEKEGILGGHVNTYTVPGTNITIDYGVQSTDGAPVVVDFFNRFNVSLTATSQSPSNLVYADFSTGQPLNGFVASAFNATFYDAQLAKYLYLQWTTELPDPVPEDLLLTWGDFLVKYGIESSA
jgi:UDP-galactopyranose mutase